MTFDEAFDQALARAKGDFGMSKKPTNPVSYLRDRGVKSLFRFILTHPDMDHLDGFDSLTRSFSVANFWDSGVRREKPDFGECPQYEEKDWDRYAEVRDGTEPAIKVITPLAGAEFKYANKIDEGETGPDGLSILAPDPDLVAAANASGNVNDASYVILYRSSGGRILIPGDAHDETWDYVIKNYSKAVANCSVLFAPHHGRKSGRSFDFLDVVRPKITFFGCASSGDLAYQAWSSRKLRVITNNQAGNIVINCADKVIQFYVQNAAYAKANGCDLEITNSQGYTYYDTVESTPE